MDLTGLWLYLAHKTAENEKPRAATGSPKQKTAPATTPPAKKPKSAKPALEDLYGELDQDGQGIVDAVADGFTTEQEFMNDLKISRGKLRARITPVLEKFGVKDLAQLNRLVSGKIFGAAALAAQLKNPLESTPHYAKLSVLEKIVLLSMGKKNRSGEFPDNDEIAIALQQPLATIRQTVAQIMRKLAVSDTETMTAREVLQNMISGILGKTAKEAPPAQSSAAGDAPEAKY